jgi:hypothetical protein
MLKVTGYVMLFAPLAVWAAIMATVSKNGLGVLEADRLYGRLHLAADPVGHSGHRRLYRHRAQIQSSAAADPRTPHDRVLDREFGSRVPETLEGLNRFGASSQISSFVLPLGYRSISTAP